METQAQSRIGKAIYEHGIGNPDIIGSVNLALHSTWSIMTAVELSKVFSPYTNFLFYNAPKTSLLKNTVQFVAGSVLVGPAWEHLVLQLC